MSDLRQAAQQALAALVDWWGSFPDFRSLQDKVAIAALRKALEQQQAEPIPTHRITSWGHCGVCRHDRIPGEGCARQECPDSPQQQAEPIGWLDGNDKLAEFMHRDLKAEHDKRGSATPRDFTVPVYTTPPHQQAEPVQEPFDDLATELFVVAQRSPADDGFSDTIDRIESWLREHFSTQPQRKELSASEILNMMPSTIPAEYDGELMEFARAVEAKIKEGA